MQLLFKILVFKYAFNQEKIIYLQYFLLRTIENNEKIHLENRLFMLILYFRNLRF